MEPPPKRLRMSPPHEPKRAVPQVDVPSNHVPVDSDLRQTQARLLASSSLAPTRTIDLSDFQRRYWDRRGVFPQRNADAHLLPRAPDVTVTANVVDIAILDGSDRTSLTQIVAPTTGIEVPISSVGTLTLPGVAQVVSNVGSVRPSATPIVTSGGSMIVSGSHGLPSSSMPANATSSSPRTVTVTSTSTLQVSLRNGTVAFTTASHRRTTYTRDGFTSTLTLDEVSSTGEATGYQFGDVVMSTLASVPTNINNSGEGSTATTSSVTEATSASAGTGGTVVLTPHQQQVVGGVVGGVAGVALVLLAILYFLKWYRKHLRIQDRLPEQSLRHRQLPSGDDHAFIQPPAMTQLSGSSVVPITTFKQSLQKLRPQSAYTLASTTTDHSSLPAPDSERSFQRVSGRKIPSVLLTGGNGYGDQGPVSPLSNHSGIPRSREVSQTSSYRGSNNSNNPFVHASGAAPISGRSTPVRAQVSPFLDPPVDDQDYSSFPMSGPLPVPRGFNSRSQLSIQTVGLSVLNPSRHSEGSVTIRPSPARTPTTTSPTSSSLRLPMNTPPLMPGDIPEMPSLHHPRFNMPPRTFSDDSLSIQRSMGQRSYSAISVRSSNSFGGKFKEEI